MTGKVEFNGNIFEVDFGRPRPIGIPIKVEINPNCYFTEPLKITPVTSDNFTGSIDLGGPVNHKRIDIAPHGNGTHTECSGHIFNNAMTLNKVLNGSLIPSQIVSVEPERKGEDSFISSASLGDLTIAPWVKALIIRTLPNSSSKLSKNYSGTNPTYISKTAMSKIVDMGVEHLLVDIPSVDPEVDGGKLSAHKQFWPNEIRRAYCSITELIFVPDEINDGRYLLNFQALRIELDASPCNPVLYALRSI